MELGFYPERSEYRSMAESGNLIPVCLEVLADTETPVSALAKSITEKVPSSCSKAGRGRAQGKYSFLGTPPWKTVRVFREAVEIETPGASLSASLNPGNRLKCCGG